MKEVFLSLINNYGLISIFIHTFLSYSLLPIPAETTILINSLILNNYSVFFVALAGSTLGSLLTYFIGYKGIDFFVNRKKSKSYNKAIKIFDKSGSWSILVFSWLPFVGDPLILIAGSLKMKFWKFFLYSTSSKIIYLILIIWFSHLLPNFLV